MINYEMMDWAHLVEARDLGWGGWDRWSHNRLRALPMLGFAAREETTLLGMGAVIWFGRRATGHFYLIEEFRADPRSRWVHRLAVKVLEAASAVSPQIYASVDPNIANSQPFLERLGFEPGQNGEWIYAFHGSGGRLGRGERADGGDGGGRGGVGADELWRLANGGGATANRSGR